MAITNLLSGYDSALPASAKRFAETSRRDEFLFQIDSEFKGYN
jgi:hypothetical protein